MVSREHLAYEELASDFPRRGSRGAFIFKEDTE